MKLSDLNRKAGSKCDICAGRLCNSSRAQWMCDALQALQYLGPLADPRFADRKSHSDVASAVLGPPGLIGPQMGQQRLVHLRYRSERSTNPDHKNWTNSVAVSFPLCNQRKEFFFNCTEYYALAALLQLRTMMRSCAYLREAARTLTLQEMPWRAPQSALAQAAHAQASAATATPPPRPTPPPPRPQRFRLRNRRCTAPPRALQTYTCQVCGSSFKKKEVCVMHMMEVCLRGADPFTRRSEADKLTKVERIQLTATYT